MKTLLSTGLVILLTISLKAQESNLIFFSQAGEKLKVYLNGVAQNPGFSTNIKVKDLNQPYYKARVVFEDRSKGEINKMIQFKPEMETVYTIKLARKGYVLRWQSEVPIAQAASPVPEQTTTVYHAEELEEADIQVQAPVVAAEVESQTEHQSDSQTNEMNMSISVPEVKMDVSMKVSETMSRISSSSNIESSNGQASSTETAEAQDDFATRQSVQSSNQYVMPGYTGKYGCPQPVSDAEFGSIKSAIESKTFADDKVTVTKQIMKSKCFTAEQVKSLLGLYTFEDDKLEIAKIAFDSTLDQGNYFKVNEAFTYSSSIDELNEFLESK